MLRREFFELIRKRGFNVTPSTLNAAIARGHVAKPVKLDDGWYDYSQTQVDDFVKYLTRTERRRLHIAATMVERGSRPGRPKKTANAS